LKLPEQIERFTGAVRKAVAELFDKHGEVTSEIILNAAMNPKSPLHARFEWDDKEAGHKYRLIQAEQLIRSYQIVIGGSRVPQYVYAPVKAAFVRTETTLTDQSLGRDVLKRMHAEAEALNERNARMAKLLEPKVRVPVERQLKTIGNATKRIGKLAKASYAV
jgi:hypothetical protein